MTHDHAPDDGAHALTVAQIEWSLPPSPHRERIPRRLLEALTPDELLALTEELQDDVSTLRATLQEAIHMLARTTADRDRLRRALRVRW